MIKVTFWQSVSNHWRVSNYNVNWTEWWVQAGSQCRQRSRSFKWWPHQQHTQWIQPCQCGLRHGIRPISTLAWKVRGTGGPREPVQALQWIQPAFCLRIWLQVQQWGTYAQEAQEIISWVVVHLFRSRIGNHGIGDPFIQSNNFKIKFIGYSIFTFIVFTVQYTFTNKYLYFRAHAFRLTFFRAFFTFYDCFWLCYLIKLMFYFGSESWLVF